MFNIDKFIEAIKKTVKIIDKMGKEDVIYVFTHIDADGISSAGIMGKLLHFLDKPFIIKPLKQIRKDVLENINNQIEPREVIFLDMGSSELKTIYNSFIEIDKLIIIDHHVPEGIKPSDINFTLSFFNSWLLGINGTTEISSAGLTYLIARPYVKIYNRIYECIENAITGALGDNQDIGEKRSLIGLNKLILEEGEKQGIVREEIDIMIYRRDSKPLYQALAETYNPELPGITGSEEAALEFLKQLGIIRVESDKYKTLSQISNEDKRKLFDQLVSRLIFSYSDKFTVDEIRDMLMGFVYVFPREPLGPIRNGREFAGLLNACGKMNRPDIGIAISLGDRDELLNQALKLLDAYQKTLSELYNRTWNEIEIKGKLVVVNGYNWLDENLTSSVSSMISFSNKLKQSGVIAVIGKSDNDYAKVSLRVTSDLKDKINLKELINKILNEIPNASGGGHTVAAGAYVPSNNIDHFITILSNLVNEVLM